ncbi:MAG: Mrp/NBP35 family ATP-binding protein [Ktedonobacterales bacterium]
MMWPQRERARVDGVGKTLVVGSGKGGVGKSTVSVNLALALAQRGLRIGLLDADAYGPSVPLMLGVRKQRASHGWTVTLPLGQRSKLEPEHMLQPLERYGVSVMSVGFFIGEEQPVAPMPDVLGVLIRNLLQITQWGGVDYLIIDLPPGTGEPQATLCRELALDGAILVTTPQDVARLDAAKALAMFRQVGTPVLGLVENMGGFICPHCGERVDVFPAGRAVGTHLDEIRLLGSIPLDPRTAASGDQGLPIVVAAPESAVGRAFVETARQIVEVLHADTRPPAP